MPQLLSAIHEIRELIRLMAEPAIAELRQEASGQSCHVALLGPAVRRQNQFC